jgi:hypothetical protein
MRTNHRHGTLCPVMLALAAAVLFAVRGFAQDLGIPAELSDGSDGRRRIIAYPPICT